MVYWLRPALVGSLALVVMALLPTQVVRADSHEEKKEEEWLAKWSNGHKVEKGDSFKLKFGGRIQADYRFASADEELEEALGTEIDGGFNFRRARLFFEGTIYERVKFKAQYDFAGGDADFKDVWVALKLAPGELKFGHAKEHFSLGELTSSKYLAFLERATPTEAFSASRNSGISFSSSPNERFNYGLGVHYDADDFGTSVDPDRFNMTGRAVYRPIYEDSGSNLLHVGLSATQKQIETGGTLRFRGRPGAGFGPRPIDTGGIPADDALGLNLELAGVHGPVWWQAEYYNLDVSSPSDLVTVGPAQVDPTLDGFYVQAGYYLTGEHRRYKTSVGAFDRQKPKKNWDRSGGRGAWEIAARFTTTDLSEAGGGELDTYTLGLNWYLNPATRFMMNLVSAETANSGDVEFVLFRWQVDF